MTKKTIRTLVFIFVLLVWVIRLFHGHSENNQVIVSDGTCTDAEWVDSLSYSRLHQRAWLEYYSEQSYCAEYATDQDLVQEAAEQRNHFEMPDWRSDQEYWGDVYRKLYHQDHERLGFVLDSLARIASSGNLDRDELARLVVSFVQDIPYNYIMPEGCEGYDSHPCVPNERFGILSPVEFLDRLEGDCDTRTVLLFSLLKDLGYAPVIINSSEYGHSMLALDIPTSGEHFTYKGRRYAFWETTNVGWLPGMIPPDMQNKNYWDVVLDIESL